MRLIQSTRLTNNHNINKKGDKGMKEKLEALHKALLAVYSDIELQNVEGGSDELNNMVIQALELMES